MVPEACKHVREEQNCEERERYALPLLKAARAPMALNDSFEPCQPHHLSDLHQPDRLDCFQRVTIRAVNEILRQMCSVFSACGWFA